MVKFAWLGLPFAALFAAQSGAPESRTLDLYPQVRALVLEAEAVPLNPRVSKHPKDRFNRAGNVLVRAGYLDDAGQAYVKSGVTASDPPLKLWWGWIVYGDIDRAEKVMKAAVGDKKIEYLASSAELLWRMGQTDEARDRYDAARELAMKVPDARRRAGLLAMIDKGLKYTSGPPPGIISATPHPRPRIPDSPIPQFPITADGFEDISPAQRSDRAHENAGMMTQLYARAAAGDRPGMEQITERAATPFQKALGFASLEHILIQEHQPRLAEEYADKIPETDAPSSLAKAEALNAAAMTWLRAGNEGSARADFESAGKIVLSLHGLPLGRISVLLSIATARIKGNMAEEGARSFDDAMAIAQELPARPRVPRDVRRPPVPLGVHYEDEAFNKILRAAIHLHEIKIANDVAERWRNTDEGADGTIAYAWFEDGQYDQAISAARSIKDPDSRVSSLLLLAENILTEAGAPIF